MILNLLPINVATTTSWATGDINGPSMRWVDAPSVSGTWTKAHEPGDAVTVITSQSRYIMLLATMFNATSSVTTTTLSDWTKATEPTITDDETSTETRYWLMLALTNSGVSTAAHGQWHKETV